MKPLKIIFLLIVLIILINDIIVGQNKAYNIWYFGDYAGIDFNQSPPTPLTDGAIQTDEGCASISDQNGNLLFYTDGVNVWDKGHQVMPLGNGLQGDNSSSQSAIIIPFPNNSNKYYIFTNYTTNGLFYSVVDISLPGNGTTIDPKGDIEPGTKNTALIGGASSEKLTAVYQDNSKNFWVIARGVGIQFRAYFVDQTGVNPPVTSDVGTPPNSAAGCMRINAQGNKIVVGDYDVSSSVVEIYDFDKITGKVSNPQSITNIIRAYGFAFSSNDSLLYISGNGRIYQYEVYPSSGTIASTETDIVGTSIGTVLTLQLAPDCKIYATVNGDTALHVINDPNNKTNPDFIKHGFDLGGQTTRGGLPNFISESFVLNIAGGENVICNSTDSIKLYITGGSAINHEWKDKNGIIGTNDTIWVLPDITTTYYLTGSYACSFFTDSVIINVIKPDTAYVIGDTTIIAGSSTPLFAFGGTNYNWSPAEGLSCINCADPIATPSITTNYLVDITDSNGCIFNRSVVVEVLTNEIWIPNAFSPNGDLKNDLFYVRETSGILKSAISIFDRIGDIVFHTEKPTTGWNGTYNGREVTSGVLTYYYQAELLSGQIINKKGNLTLNR